jgi:hypothetical protein
LPKHLLTVVAQGHSVDAQTNNLTIFSVLEEVSAFEFPVALPQFSVVTLWERCQGEEGVSFVQRTRLLDPEGVEVFHFDNEFRLEKPRHRSLGNIGMVPFHEPGKYVFEIQVRKADETEFVSVAEFPLRVRAASKPEDSLFPSTHDSPGRPT